MGQPWGAPGSAGAPSGCRKSVRHPPIRSPEPGWSRDRPSRNRPALGAPGVPRRDRKGRRRRSAGQTAWWEARSAPGWSEESPRRRQRHPTGLAAPPHWRPAPASPPRPATGAMPGRKRRTARGAVRGAWVPGRCRNRRAVAAATLVSDRRYSLDVSPVKPNRPLRPAPSAPGSEKARQRKSSDPVRTEGG
jgi:hypothetical protein